MFWVQLVSSKQNLASSIDQGVLNSLFLCFRTPLGDLFATKMNHQLPLCVTDVWLGSLGSGRTDPKLESHVLVRISPVHTDTNRASEGFALSAVQVPTNSAILAPEVVVQWPTGLLIKSTSASSFSGRHTVFIQTRQWVMLSSNLCERETFLKELPRASLNLGDDPLEWSKIRLRF